MKVETQELPDSEVALNLEVEDARVEQAMDTAYRRLAGRVNIAGFRRGKAPRALVERVIGRESLLEEALNVLLPEVFDEAVREANVEALTEPVFDVESITPLKAKATVVVPPPVELGDYHAIHRDRPEVAVSDEEVDGVLQSLRESHAEWVPVERAAALGDRVAMDIVGVEDDNEVLRDEDVEFELTEGSPVPVPGFAEALVGIEAGQTRHFELPVPAEQQETPEPVEGEAPEEPKPSKMIVFDVTVQDVKGKELPELDDALATTVGSYKDLDELKTRIREQLRERDELESKAKLENEILSEAVDQATVQIPEKLVAQEAQRMRDRLARDLDSRGLSIEQYQRVLRIPEEEMIDRYRQDAERALRRGFVLRAIAEHEHVEVSEDDVDASVREAMGADGADRRAIERALRQAEIRARVRSALLEQRTAKWLVDEATGGDASDGAASGESAATPEPAMAGESEGEQP
ncbi:MAG: trigger factor [Chloroflexota bacterium]|jgi:trigger factor|nr:trigger factor [Chloroflexota bacterium]